MAANETDQILDALNELLEVERTTLLTGKLNDLAGMVDEKERLVGLISKTQSASPDALRLLDLKVKRNQLLLDGALEGIRAVARRLTTLRQVRASLETYDAKGTRKAIDIARDPSVEKRA